MPRLGYTKSRNGCMRCRQRRVKCDEKRPCSACIRHEVRCSLLDSNPSRDAAAGSRARSTSIGTSTGSLSEPTSGISPGSTVSSNDAALGSQSGLTDLHESVSSKLLAQSSRRPEIPEDPFPYFDKFMLPSGTDREAAWINDLELIHHYGVETAATLPRAQEELQVWQRLVPAMAFKYPYVVHQIMAVSGYHLAYLNPAQREVHALHASQHQHKAIQGIRDSIPSITPESCHALFAGSSLLLVGAFAALANGNPDGSYDEGQRRPTMESIIDTFILNRGVASVLHTFEHHISTGTFKDLFVFKFPPNTSPRPFLDRCTAELQNLAAALKKERIDPVVAILVDYEITKMITAVEKAVFTTLDPELRVTTYWPITIAEDYITLLRQRNEIALVVMCYLCAVMHKAAEKSWYLKGWGKSLVLDIESSISTRWHEAIRWPLEVVMGNPP